ncbi:MAG TPA: response regulator [Ramlibacter sp.]|jgi:CheY-like chemotaxis protein|uniref:response regulator n=1 Tax=Ramlibacter sp. TaxID=1917967 RepID=UPI002D40A6A4|nr:response regulator [Ramlibacter sp.]HZY18370.1 response regulator [Ramlibacter sp.]
MPGTPGQRSGQGLDSVLAHITQDARSATAPAPVPEPAAEPAPPPVEPDRSSTTILVVDDHEAGRYAMAKLLQRAGFRTLEADSGTEAFALAESAAAVLLDVNLPDVNGVEVCRVLKSRRPTAHLPVLLVSAVYIDELHRGAGLSSGADAYLVSPLESGELVPLLDRLLAASRAR